VPTAQLSVDDEADALIAIYSRAARRIRAIVRAATARGAAGTARHYELQLRKVELELDRARRDSQPLREALTRRSYLTGVAAIDRVLRLDKTFSGVHSDAMAVLSAALANRLDAATERVGRETRDVFRQVGLEEVAVGVATGQTRREVSRQIAQRLRFDHALTAFVDSRGRRWKLDTYAAMVARTTTREAVSLGTRNRLVEYGRRIATVSKHANACPICAPLQGRTFALVEGVKGYELLERLPPFHPNCRHVLMPAKASFEAFEEALGLGPMEDEPEPERDPRTGEEGPQAPDPDERPEGVHPRDRVRYSSIVKAEAEHLEDQVDAIGRVHRVPPSMGEIPTAFGMSGDNMGQHESRGIPDQGKVVFDSKITLNRATLGMIQRETGSPRDARPISSFVHEFGHALDAHNFGEPLTIDHAQNRKWASSREREWLDAVKASDAYSLIPRSDTYALSTVELWARSYEQWIATRTGNTSLNAKIEHIRRQHGSWRYWDAFDFEPIAEAFDKFFAEKGLLLEPGGRDDD
jgi:hypothetical protein